MKRVCYLCGNPADTKDHLPPKGFFPKPAPVDLIMSRAAAAATMNLVNSTRLFGYLLRRRKTEMLLT